MAGVICCITQIHAPHYYLTDDNSFIKFGEEDNYRPWNIQDAKDGDVLSCESGWTCIFKTLVNDETFSSYCFMDKTKWFCETGSECHTLKEEYVKAYNGKIYPATKEQRDLLFKKMKEAGYEWDAEKKELRKIEEEVNGEDYGIDSLYHAQRILEKTLGKVDGYQSDDGILEHKCAISAVKKLYEQKPTWSEEDEHGFENCLHAIKETFKGVDNPHRIGTINWFKSLKGRVQPKQDWSKEDEKIYQSIMDDTVQENQLDDKQTNWLRDIKYRNQWKPSDEQMETLKYACGGNYVNLGILDSLYQDLKKLKGK